MYCYNFSLFSAIYLTSHVSTYFLKQKSINLEMNGDSSAIKKLLNWVGKIKMKITSHWKLGDSGLRYVDSAVTT